METINIRLNTVTTNIDNTTSTHNTNHTIPTNLDNQPIILDQDINEQEPIFL